MDLLKLVKSTIALAVVAMFAVPFYFIWGGPILKAFEDRINGEVNPMPIQYTLPSLSNYYDKDGRDMTSLVDIAVKFGLPKADRDSLSGSLKSNIGFVNEVIKCAHDLGMVTSKGYANKEDVRWAGFIVAADQQKSLNVDKLIACIAVESVKDIVPNMSRGIQTFVLEPCSHSFTAHQNSRTFHVAYVATHPDVCKDFCASLVGCNKGATSTLSEYEPIAVGKHKDGTEMFVCMNMGSSIISNGTHIGKLYSAPNGERLCYISWGSEEHVIDKYSVPELKEDSYRWIKIEYANLAKLVDIGGFYEFTSGDIRKLYSCKAKIDNGWHSGKFGPKEKICWIPFGGAELVYRDGYEVLVRR